MGLSLVTSSFRKWNNMRLFSSTKDNKFNKIVNIMGLKFKFKDKNKYYYSKIKKLIAAYYKEIKEQQIKEDEKQNIQSNMLSGLSTIVNEIYQINSVAQKFYQNSFEQSFLKPFIQYMKHPDFNEKYLKLISNLPEEDVFTINNIIRRIQIMTAYPNNAKINIYNTEEQKQRKNLFDNFFNKILKVNDELYVYGKYKLPVNHFEPCVFYYKHGMETLKNTDRIRQQNIIDAGGFIGDSALVLSSYTEKKIYSFEAIPANLQKMQKTIELNSLSNVIPVNKALYSKKTELEFNICDSASSSVKLEAIPEGEKVKVQAIALDEFVKEHNLDVGLIKVDLEGAEQEFLQGALNTIKEQKPTLLFSIYHKPEDFFEIKPILESLNLGYKFRIYNPVDFAIEIETLLIAEIY